MSRATGLPTAQLIDASFLASLLAEDAKEFEGPASYRLHWTTRRKATLVFAIEGGKIDIGRARSRFRLSEEELQSWIAATETNSIPGLRATRYQIYRDNPLPRGNCYQSSKIAKGLDAPTGEAQPIMRRLAGR